MIKKLVQIQTLKRLCVKLLAFLQAELRQKKNLKMYFTSFLNSVRFWHTPFFKRTMGKIKAVVHLFAKNVESHESRLCCC